jgi:phage tail sheath protein FI
MPVTPTYPGVYIEEITSGVHTITGVATSIAAFVDTFRRGPLNEAVHLFSVADFEREFGGLDSASEASYAIQQFFLNGGSEAYVVRVAGGTPQPATVVVEDSPLAGGIEVFRVRAGEQIHGSFALNPGEWGNALRAEIDYNTAGPEFFNLTVSEISNAGGQLRTMRSETYRNLTLRPGATNNALDVVNAGSSMIQLDRTAAMPELPTPFVAPFVRPAATGTMGSNLLVAAPLAIPANNASFKVSDRYPVGGSVATAVEAGGATPISITTASAHELVTGDQVTITGVNGFAAANGTFTITIVDATQFTLDGVNTAGNGTGGTWTLLPNFTCTIEYPVFSSGNVGSAVEAGGATPISITTASAHELVTGDQVTIAGVNGFAVANGTFTITVVDATHFTLDGVNTAGNGTGGTWTFKGVRDFPSLRPHVEVAIRAVAPDNPLLAGASVLLVGKGTVAAPYRFVIQAGRGGSAFNPETILTFSNAAGTTADALGLTGALANVQQYSLGSGTLGAQSGAVPGNNGTAPNATALRGVRADKTGMYALEEVDLFNILSLSAAATLSPTNMAAVLTEAETYCEEKRAFLLVDIPANITTLAAMQTWMSQNDTLRHRNAAVYFPRPMIPDRLNDNRLRSVGASGTIAGLFAKTDANRGVWKAPAGVEAKLVNVQDLPYVLSDPENGALNPLGINCLRRFPIYGHISWGARTLDGADQQASEWKYVPVRRLALFLEESLYRGTKWVVFEPNDEPLRAQIRLNVGAFMHNLFRQGAFQGKTPREAYLVKCDSETTTQNDIDLGIVNILVGFAPLKPAEFVIIKIQQLAGQIDV